MTENSSQKRRSTKRFDRSAKLRSARAWEIWRSKSGHLKKNHQWDWRGTPLGVQDGQAKQPNGAGGR